MKEDRISECNEIRRHKEEYLVSQDKLIIKMSEGMHVFTITYVIMTYCQLSLEPNRSQPMKKSAIRSFYIYTKNIALPNIPPTTKSNNTIVLLTHKL
jgi:hypothetical protein